MGNILEKDTNKLTKFRNFYISNIKIECDNTKYILFQFLISRLVYQKTTATNTISVSNQPFYLS